MRIQLCGRLVVRLGARRVEDALPGTKGRLLFAYLVLNRLRRIDRDELVAPTLPRAADGGRRLIELAPHRESGYRILVEPLAQRGNVAAALLVYDRLRLLLHDELRIAPSHTLRSVHRRLLEDTAAARR